MRRDPTEFRKRFNRWKNGELVYEAGLPKYTTGKDGDETEFTNPYKAGDLYNLSPECAYFSNHTLNDQGYMMSGNAWTPRGADVIFNGFTGIERPNAYDETAYNQYALAAADNVFKNFNTRATLDPNKVYTVNMYHESSKKKERAFNEGDSVYGTHTGYLNYEPKDDTWYVTHNIDGKLYKDRFGDLQRNGNPNRVTAIFAPRKATMWNRIKTKFGFDDGKDPIVYDTYKPEIVVTPNEPLHFSGHTYSEAWNQDLKDLYYSGQNVRDARSAAVPYLLTALVDLPMTLTGAGEIVNVAKGLYKTVRHPARTMRAIANFFNSPKLRKISYKLGRINKTLDSRSYGQENLGNGPIGDTYSLALDNSTKKLGKLIPPNKIERAGFLQLFVRALDEYGRPQPETLEYPTKYRKLFSDNPEYYQFIKQTGLNPDDTQTVSTFLDRQSTMLRGVRAEDSERAMKYLTETLFGRPAYGGDRLHSKGGLYASNSSGIANAFKNAEQLDALNSYIGKLKFDFGIDKTLPIDKLLQQWRNAVDLHIPNINLTYGTDILLNNSASPIRIIESPYGRSNGDILKVRERVILPNYSTTEPTKAVNLVELQQFGKAQVGNGRWNTSGVDYVPQDNELFIPRLLNRTTDYIKMARKFLKPKLRVPDDKTEQWAKLFDAYYEALQNLRFTRLKLADKADNLPIETLINSPWSHLVFGGSATGGGLVIGANEYSKYQTDKVNAWFKSPYYLQYQKASYGTNDVNKDIELYDKYFEQFEKSYLK